MAQRDHRCNKYFPHGQSRPGLGSIHHLFKNNIQFNSLLRHIDVIYLAIENL